MNRHQLISLCLSYSGAEEVLSGHPHNIKSYSVGQKKFAYFKTSQPEKWRFSLRVTPERFLELTDQLGIKPARYMQRFHWVTIVDVQTIEDESIKELLNWSYKKALSSLSKKRQAEIGK